MLHHELAQELAIEPVQVVDRVEQAVARPHPQKQRDLAQPRLQVDDHRRLLAEPRQLHAAVHRQGRRAGAALGAEEHQRRGRWLGALCGLAASRRPAHGAVEGFLVGWPGEELVGAGAHRLQDQVGIGGHRDREDPGAGRAGAQTFDARHRRRGVAADIDDDQVGHRGLASSALVDHADRNRARTQEAPEVFLERVVFRDDEANQLCHGPPTSTTD